MKGIVKILADFGVTPKALREGGHFDYHLWRPDEEYSIRVEGFGADKVELSLREFGRDMWPNRHIYGDFDDMISALAEVEEEVYVDRKIPFWRKPRELWKRFEASLEKKGGN